MHTRSKPASTKGRHRRLQKANATEKATSTTMRRRKNDLQTFKRTTQSGSKRKSGPRRAAFMLKARPQRLCALAVMRLTLSPPQLTARTVMLNTAELARRHTKKRRTKLRNAHCAGKEKGNEVDCSSFTSLMAL